MVDQYAINATIYPLITIVMAPVATFLYETVNMSTLFYLVAGMEDPSFVTDYLFGDSKAVAKELEIVFQINFIITLKYIHTMHKQCIDV